MGRHNWGAAAEEDAIDIVAPEVRVRQTSVQRASQCGTAYVGERGGSSCNYDKLHCL